MNDHPLKFQVAPHIVEDLGLNLYTSLPRVLAEFVANAYDADSPFVDIRLDMEAIAEARTQITAEFKRQQQTAHLNGEAVPPLASRVLPPELTITIEDGGHGMSRDDLRTKFLIAGRRRRKENDKNINRTEGQRPLMGRKGLGKLAGFGVAKRVEVVSRRRGEGHATKVILDYDALVSVRNVMEVEVPEERLDDGGGFADGSGTRVTLSYLLHDPARSRQTTIERELAEHFEFVDPADFEIQLNGARIPPVDRQYAFAWPEPERPPEEFVSQRLLTDEKTVSFEYRLRFTPDRKALPAEKRGVRVYAGPRLASTPSLLDADTNMHGFRMTDYLDGVVRAPFIDLQENDYIATDRQSLRWEAPLLAPLKDFLSAEIKESCKQYQKVRDDRLKATVERDPFTPPYSPRESKTHRLACKC